MYATVPIFMHACSNLANLDTPDTEHGRAQLRLPAEYARVTPATALTCSFTQTMVTWTRSPKRVRCWRQSIPELAWKPLRHFVQCVAPSPPPVADLGTSTASSESKVGLTCGAAPRTYPAGHRWQCGEPDSAANWPHGHSEHPHCAGTERHKVGERQAALAQHHVSIPSLLQLPAGHAEQAVAPASTVAACLPKDASISKPGNTEGHRELPRTSAAPTHPPQQQQQQQ